MPGRSLVVAAILCMVVLMTPLPARPICLALAGGAACNSVGVVNTSTQLTVPFMAAHSVLRPVLVIRRFDSWPRCCLPCWKLS